MAIADIHRYLDHAVLKPETTRDEAREAIQLGIDHEVRTVCVRPSDIVMAVEMCSGTRTAVSNVVAFPHGNTQSCVKAEETKRAIDAGTSEIDMVGNIGWIRSAMWESVTEDIGAVVDSAKGAGVLVKVILETAYLTIDQIRRATICAIDAGADFVKTSTGFAPEGATEEAVRAMLCAASGRIKVKASGGIRDRERAELFINMGVARIGNGSTSTPAICSGTGAGEGAY
jgi:deoxyribose-phosphate aldolase